MYKKNIILNYIKLDKLNNLITLNISSDFDNKRNFLKNALLIVLFNLNIIENKRNILDDQIILFIFSTQKKYFKILLLYFIKIFRHLYSIVLIVLIIVLLV